MNRSDSGRYRYTGHVTWPHLISRFRASSESVRHGRHRGQCSLVVEWAWCRPVHRERRFAWSIHCGDVCKGEPRKRCPWECSSKEDFAVRGKRGNKVLIKDRNRSRGDGKHSVCECKLKDPRDQTYFTVVLAIVLTVQATLKCLR